MVQQGDEARLLHVNDLTLQFWASLALPTVRVAPEYLHFHFEQLLSL
jgi:hypothetical protein